MLNNKADTIEEYIRKRLEQNASGQIELKRTALADEISCAPSQISYVLSTRFTTERGFVVESRRGLGGYIRIALIPQQLDQKQILFNDIVNEIDASVTNWHRWHGNMDVYSIEIYMNGILFIKLKNIDGHLKHFVV